MKGFKSSGKNGKGNMGVRWTDGTAKLRRLQVLADLRRTESERKHGAKPRVGKADGYSSDHLGTKEERKRPTKSSFCVLYGETGYMLGNDYVR